MKLFELFAELSLDSSGFTSGVKNATKQGNGLASTLKNGIGGAATYVGQKVSATTIMLGNLMADAAKKGVQLISDTASAGIKYNATMETYVTNFRTMLGGSSEAAQQLTTDLEDMAASTPFAMSDLADATQTLLAFGQDSSTVLDTLQSLGDISMGDANKLQSLTLAYAQASSSGKLMQQDLNQMINAGFNPLQTIVEETGASMGDLKEYMSSGKASSELKKQMKVAKREVKEFGDEASDGAKMLAQMAEEGGISADLLGQIFEIETSPGGRFYNAMEAASQTYEGMISTLQDDTNALLGKVFKPLSNWMTDDLLPTAISAVGEISEAFDNGGISAAVKKATDLAGDYLDQLGDKALTIGSGVLANVLTGLTGDDVNEEEVKKFFTDLWSDIETGAKSGLSFGSDLLNGIYTSLTSDEGNRKNIVDFFSDLWSDVEGTTSNFVEAAGSALGAVYETATGQEATGENVGSSAGNLIKALFNRAEGFANTASAGLYGIAALLSDEEDKEKNQEAFVKSAANGVTSFLEAIGNTVTAFTGDEKSFGNFLSDLSGFEEERILTAYKHGMTLEELDKAGIGAATTSTHEFGYTAPDEGTLRQAYEYGVAAGYYNAGEEEKGGNGAWSPSNTGLPGQETGAAWYPGARWKNALGPSGDEDAASALAKAAEELAAVAAGLPDAAASSAAASINGAKVEMDGQTVGMIVLPYVSSGISRQTRAVVKTVYP